MLNHIERVALAAAFLFAFAGTAHSRDLSIRITGCPEAAKAGQNLGPALRVEVENHGDKGVKNAELRLVLRKSPTCTPSGRPVMYSPGFFDGVLLREGRQYVSLEPGKSVKIRPYGENTVPVDTPVGGTYFICAEIAGDVREKEGGEPVLCSCRPIRIVGAEEMPVITGFSETCLTAGNTVTILGRNLGRGDSMVVVLEADGMTIELMVVSWGDNAIVARIPDDGRITYGREYAISIRRRYGSEMPANGKAVFVCPERKPLKSPESVPPPVPPFLFQDAP